MRFACVPIAAGQERVLLSGRAPPERHDRAADPNHSAVRLRAQTAGGGSGARQRVPRAVVPAALSCLRIGRKHCHRPETRQMVLAATVIQRLSAKSDVARCRTWAGCYCSKCPVLVLLRLAGVVCTVGTTSLSTGQLPWDVHSESIVATSKGMTRRGYCKEQQCQGRVPAETTVIGSPWTLQPAVKITSTSLMSTSRTSSLVQRT